MGEIEDFFDPAEFHMEFVERPDGGLDIFHTITGKTRLFIEREAAKAGMSFNDYLKHKMLEGFPSNQP